MRRGSRFDVLTVTAATRGLRVFIPVGAAWLAATMLGCSSSSATDAGATTTTDAVTTPAADVPTTPADRPDAGGVPTSDLGAKADADPTGDVEDTDAGTQDAAATSDVAGTFGLALWVAPGGYHACALNAANDIACWGRNIDGQLGDGTTSMTAQSEPSTTVTFPAEAGRIAAAGVDCGDEFSCALTERHALYCWGKNDHGQLGDGTTTRHGTPALIAGPSDVRHFSAGANFACAVDATQRVWCWGAGQQHQLGDGAFAPSDRPTPGLVMGVASASAVSSGGQHSCAIVTGSGGSGQVMCWGDNTYGQLGDGTTPARTAAVAVSGITDAVSIAAGGFHTCVVRSGGEIRCWGSNDHGQLGNGAAGAPIAMPTAVTGAWTTDTTATIQGVTAGGAHTCALVNASTSRVYCWGFNQWGQLGDGSMGVDRRAPVPAMLTATASLVAAGYGYTCALTGASTDSLHCWGENDTGALGDGTTTDRTTPTAVVGF